MKFENIRVTGFDAAFRGMRNPKNSWHLADSKFGICPNDYVYDRIDDVASDWIEFLNRDLNDESLREKIQDWLWKNGCLYEGDCGCFEYAFIGPKDMKLAQQLICGGSEHRKFLRQIQVSVDITAPLYWWKEFDTYKVGTVANSTSTMHKITSKPITLDCFEMDDWEEYCTFLPDFLGEEGLSADDCESMIVRFIGFLEGLRLKYLETKDYRFWKELIRWLPESWLQTRTVTMNYENLLSMLHQRKFHKLNEWSGDKDYAFESFVKFARKLPYANLLLLLEEYLCNEFPVIDFS